MKQEKSPAGPGALMTLMVLAGLGLFVWHLVIHPEDRLTDPGPSPPVRAEGIAPFVAVASRHDDGAAVGFTAVVHHRDQFDFIGHLRHIAVQRGWYPHRSGEGYALVVPETELHLLYEMEADPIGWAHRHGDGGLDPVPRPTDESRLVNAVVWVEGQVLSGILRILAIALWVLAIFPAMDFLCRWLSPDMAGGADKPVVQQ